MGRKSKKWGNYENNIINNYMEKILKQNGYKKYTHTSGFSAWSKSNLCEYSDEWELLDNEFVVVCHTDKNADDKLKNLTF